MTIACSLCHSVRITINAAAGTRTTYICTRGKSTLPLRTLDLRVPAAYLPLQRGAESAPPANPAAT
jgi:hypothetical protein